MIITKETKERFLQMLDAGQIICIRANKKGRATYDYKVIGANDSGKWDFTPMAATVSNYPNNRGGMELAIMSRLSAADIIEDVLKELQKENLFRSDLTGWDLHHYANNHITTFFI